VRGRRTARRSGPGLVGAWRCCSGPSKPVGPVRVADRTGAQPVAVQARAGFENLNCRLQTWCDDP